ncbi:putative ABC transport system permease protein [Chryseolinea serpens]|uniref:Putative ABC transport system permease protein n=1 Tax=Chryseolinea serpens TaxID=947013 RepID=A0A1M5MSN7_9BACT|nr:ABC transporter permease [Chryseolinea serpens]SHG80246.1 putative ABC transport system permease protein [Chryseolinea serpens]
MIASYIRVAFRNFRSQKAFTSLNVAGLSLGLTASLLIFQYVKYERSFDAFHSRAKDIYRIQYNSWKNGRLDFESAVAVPAVGPALKNNFPEVEAFTRLYPVGGLMTYHSPTRGTISFQEEKVPYADPALFKVFDFRLIRGDEKTALQGPRKIVLSEQAARKYFGDEDPLGKTITYAGEENFEVTGIMANVPENSHIRFDLLLSYQTLKEHYSDHYQTSWGWYDFYTYVLLKPGTDVKALQAKWDSYLLSERKVDWGEGKQEFILRPLTDIHLYSNLLYEANPNDQRDGDSIQALETIAFFILIIAGINYINLTTARSFSRANEVGVRKVIGALRSQLIIQFYVESFLLNLVALVLAMALVVFCWPAFSKLSGWQIPMDFLSRTDFWIQVLGVVVGGVILSGFYPALVMSSFKPIAVLKGKSVKSPGGNLLRKALVVFQFATSVFLICGAVLVYRQLEYMKSSKLGISIDNTIVLKGPGNVDSLYQQHLEVFGNEVTQIPGVKSFTSSTNIPGVEIYWTGGIKRFAEGPADFTMVSHVAIDYDFIAAFGVKIIAGRNFSKDYPGDEKRLLVNRKLTETLQFKNPADAVGEKVSQQGDTLEIVGVVEDYHQMSLKSELLPMAFMLRPAARFYAIKVESMDAPRILTAIENPWKTSFPETPLDYFFLDQFYNRQYDKDNRFGKVFTLFTGLAIFIASLGLLGLASHVTTARAKEIGIRKVLGSSIAGIVVLLLQGFMIPVVIACLLAWPLSWWATEIWLQSFPYRVSTSPMMFIISGASITVIAFLCVFYQTLKAALLSPAKMLKYE